VELTLQATDGVRWVEGAPATPFLTTAAAVDRVIEACFGEGVNAVLLYAPNLPATFFDLSSGDAGVILQKLQQYQIRLALVAPEGEVRLSRMFPELLADERRGTRFDSFQTRAAAVDWLHRHGR
jgi:Domain of unknown function (DUF4180)